MLAADDGGLTMTFDATNTGERDGDEVVQLNPTLPAAPRPGERRSSCGFARNSYVVPTGNWTLGAGASSADMRQRVSPAP